MVALDGNAIGGLLLEVFGTDLTAAQTICATCGNAAAVAETVVYLRAPGTVVRCSTKARTDSRSDDVRPGRRAEAGC